MGIELDIRGNVLRDGHVEPSDALEFWVEPSDAPEFWSVYRREQDGCWCWLADFDTRAEAVTYAGGLHG